jgi:hypothetical protein
VRAGQAAHPLGQAEGITTGVVAAAREEAGAGQIAVGYREPGYLRTTVHEYVGSAQVQCVTALRHTAGKSYPSPDRYGRAASCTCARTSFCASGERARRTGEADADVSVR